jgi:alkanesulfonate monooxygenase SsuD/methylene tetrahydromethanopterin reductase-like flavin-dependent oxidoreductase (luciferase family)
MEHPEFIAPVIMQCFALYYDRRERREQMKFAINLPNFGPFGDPRLMADLAREAEAAGWDGFFIWDHVMWTDPVNHPVTEPWVTLAAIACATTRIRLGPMITPLPRRRPWQVARQAVTLDQLSGGRLALGVGIGGDWFGDYSRFGEPADDRTHGEQLDEALEVLVGLWSGEPFSYAGKHYTVRDTQFLPKAVQPRIPIWVAGVWPGTKPFRRAARYDGAAPIGRGGDGDINPGSIRDLLEYIRPHRVSDRPFDVVLAGPPRSTEEYAAFAAAGATWYQDGFLVNDSPDDVRAHIRRGPPQL